MDISGGQWQKLAIARAYYRNRDFIILDERTSNLDPLAEAEVFKKYIAMTQASRVYSPFHSNVVIFLICEQIHNFIAHAVLQATPQSNNNIHPVPHQLTDQTYAQIKP